MLIRYPIGTCIRHSNGIDSFTILCGVGRVNFAGVNNCLGMGIPEALPSGSCINSQKFSCVAPTLPPTPTPTPTPTPMPATPGFRVSTRHSSKLGSTCLGSPNQYSFTYESNITTCVPTTGCANVNGVSFKHESMIIILILNIFSQLINCSSSHLLSWT